MELDKEIYDKFGRAIEPYIDADNTCNAVEEYFKNGNEPIGGYYQLGEYFRGEGDAEDHSDELYKQWLEGLVNNYYMEDMEKESIVVAALKKYYSNKEDLRKFVFYLDGMDTKLNQKWHFFISYWGYREFITRANIKGKPKPIERTTPFSRNPFNKCQEGKIWYENCRRLDIQ